MDKKTILIADDNVDTRLVLSARLKANHYHTVFAADALQATIRQYITVTNAQPKPFRWTKTADDILAGVARFCQRTSETGH